MSACSDISHTPNALTVYLTTDLNAKSAWNKSFKKYLKTHNPKNLSGFDNFL